MFSYCSSSILLLWLALLHFSYAEDYALPDVKRDVTVATNYVPTVVTCPGKRPTIREARGLSDEETAWLKIRKTQIVDPMKALLSRANISGFDASAYISSVAGTPALPVIGISVSGGGYRALMNGAGFLAAADNRTTNATNPGHIGGLLQASTYLAGLSGGNWLVGSMFTNGFASVQSLRDSTENLWKFNNTFFAGPRGGDTVKYYQAMEDAILQKSKAGWSVSFADLWGLSLTYQLINSSGIANTFSSLSTMDSFVKAETPFPIHVSDERSPDTKIISQDSTIFEFNLFELGSWDPTTYGFAPIKYLGSDFSNGVVPSSGRCVQGYDNSGLVIATSSTLFNQALLRINGTDIQATAKAILAAILLTFDQKNSDIARYNPNPFYGFNNASNRNSHSKELDLVDGAEDNQNIPLAPLIQPFRNVSVLFAIDSSADTSTQWPNGSSIINTYTRSLNATISNGTSFPSIPDSTTFLNLGLNQRPTFFGCNASNTTTPTPLIVYIPNGPYITLSNISTFDLDVNDTQRNLLIRNGYDAATQGNGTLNAGWSKCLACAILSRSFDTTRTEVPKDCVDCFKRYCWDGSVNTTATPGNYTPSFIIGEVSMEQTSGAQGIVSIAGMGSTWALIIGLVMLAAML